MYSLFIVVTKLHRFTNNEKNWGYVGDLNYINDKLIEVNKFIVD